MKVLVVSQYFWPESFRINEVVQSLQAAGCDVTVLTGQPNYPAGKTYPGYRSLGWGRDGVAGRDVLRVPLFPRGQGSAWRLAANYLSYVASATIIGSWLLRGRRFDVVFVYGISPILQVVPGIVFRATKGAALVPWVQDLWPDSLQATGYVNNARLLNAVAAAVRWIYRRSDLLLVQSRAFLAPVAAAAGAVPVVYHPNPGELAFSAPGQREPADITLAPGFNVVFAGNLGTVQALETVVECADRLRAHPDVRFVLIGSGSRGAWVQDEVRRRGLSNVHLPGRFEPEQMPALLAQASALLVSLAGGSTMDQTVPSKVQAYLAAGKPIIGALDGEGAKIINESGAGISCKAEDPQALAEAVLRLRSLGDGERAALGAAGRAYYAQHFDPAALARQLTAHFEAARARRHGAST